MKSAEEEKDEEEKEEENEGEKTTDQIIEVVVFFIVFLFFYSPTSYCFTAVLPIRNSFFHVQFESNLSNYSRSGPKTRKRRKIFKFQIFKTFLLKYVCGINHFQEKKIVKL
jgi:hypothetical protein